MLFSRATQVWIYISQAFSKTCSKVYYPCDKKQAQLRDIFLLDKHIFMWVNIICVCFSEKIKGGNCFLFPPVAVLDPWAWMPAASLVFNTHGYREPSHRSAFRPFHAPTVLRASSGCLSRHSCFVPSLDEVTSWADWTLSMKPKWHTVGLEHNLLVGPLAFPLPMSPHPCVGQLGFLVGWVIQNI